MKKLSAIMFAVMTAHSLPGALVVTFTFESDSLAPAVAESGYQVSNFSYVGSSGSVGFTGGNGGGGSYSASAWPTDGSFDDYYTFTVTPDSGFEFALSGLNLDERRSGTGPTTFTVRYAIDGGSFTTLGTSTVGDISTWTSESFSTTPMSIATSSAVEIRIFGSNAESGSGTWRLDNVAAFGTISAVPEPRSIACFLGLVVWSFGFRRSRYLRKR